MGGFWAKRFIKTGFATNRSHSVFDPLVRKKQNPLPKKASTVHTVLSGFSPGLHDGKSAISYRAFLHRENPTFKIWQRKRFVAVFRSYGKGHKKFKCLQ
jgi:hypothetical protein